MRTEIEWLNEYKRTHTHPVNVRLHTLCVPLIFWSVTAVLWSIPAPVEGLWAMVVMLATVIFYFSLSRGTGLRMLVFSSLCLAVDAFLPLLFPVAVTVFVISWIGQFIGHHYEGRKPAFFDDLVFLLIGPIWVLRKHE